MSQREFLSLSLKRLRKTCLGQVWPWFTRSSLSSPWFICLDRAGQWPGDPGLCLLLENTESIYKNILLLLLYYINIYVYVYIYIHIHVICMLYWYTIIFIALSKLVLPSTDKYYKQFYFLSTWFLHCGFNFNKHQFVQSYQNPCFPDWYIKL